MKKGKPVSKVLKNNSKKILKSTLESKILHKGFHLAIILAFVSLTVYGAYALLYKNISDNVVISEGEVVNRVAKHMALPQTPPLSVVRVENAESLRSQNNFYKDVKEGDYVIAYKNVVIIYDLMGDKLKQVASAKS